MKKNLLSIGLVLLFSFFISACGSKTAVKITPTPTPKLVEMPLSDRPEISLTPRTDGHMLYLKINGIPDYVSQIEYEVLYNAVDNGAEIEKGIGDTIKEISASLERSLLLGTESCTNGCKYKFDTGIVGGTLTLSFIDKNGQVSSFETPFTFLSSADFKSAGKISLGTEFTLTPTKTPSANNYFILMKDYRGGYSLFSSATDPNVGNYPQTP